ncbi:MAG: hypothetical protein Hals2KO_05580 [Halioglobus sp.]
MLPLDDAVRRPFEGLVSALLSQQHLPAPVLELCRLRLAQLHGVPASVAELGIAVAPAQRENLADWHRHSAFDARDRACLAFTEVYAADAQAITDALADAVKAQCGDAGLVALIEALGLLDGLLRTERLWRGINPGGGGSDVDAAAR